MRKQTALDRYRNDSTYRQVVDSMEHMIHAAQLTPSELREAAVMASINYENKRVRQYHIGLTPELHEQLETFNRMVSERQA